MAEAAADLEDVSRGYVDPTAIVTMGAVLEGNVHVGAECVCHPRGCIRALAGPVYVGESTIVEEFVDITNRCLITSLLNRKPAKAAVRLCGNSCRDERASVVGLLSSSLMSASIAGSDPSFRKVNQELNKQHVKFCREVLPTFHHMQQFEDCAPEK